MRYIVDIVGDVRRAGIYCRPYDLEQTLAKPPLFQYSAADIADLHRLLGANLDAALYGLQLAAWAYKSSREARVPTKAKRELKRVAGLLRRTEAVILALSKDATHALQQRLDWDTSRERGTYVTALQTLSHARRACGRSYPAVAKTYSSESNSPETLLAAAVSGALASSGVPMSRSRDSILARVLTIVFHAVEPERVRDDIYRHVQSAAKLGSAHTPALKPAKGRPRKK